MQQHQNFVQQQNVVQQQAKQQQNVVNQQNSAQQQQQQNVVINPNIPLRDQFSQESSPLQTKEVINNAPPQQQNSNIKQQQQIFNNNPEPPAPAAPVVNKLNYNINADIKHAYAAYDQEQRDLVKPAKNVVKQEDKVPGRDLKEDRHKRSPVVENVDDVLSDNCANDPFCEEKFHRDPASDSLVDRDMTKYLKVGNSRGLLEVTVQETNNSEKSI